MESLIEDETIRAVDDVLLELERKDDSLHEWAKARSAMFVGLDPQIQEAARKVLAEFPKMLDERSGKNMADPFVIALAMVGDCTVVTGEKGGTPNRPKIPNVCQHFGVRCVDTLAVFRELQWKF